MRQIDPSDATSVVCQSSFAASSGAIRKVCPPRDFVAIAVQVPMMFTAQWHGEFVADLASERSRLRKFEMMRITRRALTDHGTAALRRTQDGPCSAAAPFCVTETRCRVAWVVGARPTNPRRARLHVLTWPLSAPDHRLRRADLGDHDLWCPTPPGRLDPPTARASSAERRVFGGQSPNGPKAQDRRPPFQFMDLCGQLIAERGVDGSVRKHRLGLPEVHAPTRSGRFGVVWDIVPPGS